MSSFHQYRLTDWLTDSFIWQYFDLIFSCFALVESFSTSPASLPLLLPSSVSACVSCIDSTHPTRAPAIYQCLARNTYNTHSSMTKRTHTHTLAYKNTHILQHYRVYVCMCVCVSQINWHVAFHSCHHPLRRYPANSSLNWACSSRIFCIENIMELLLKRVAY